MSDLAPALRELIRSFAPLLSRMYVQTCGDSASYPDVEDKFVSHIEQPLIFSLYSDDPFSRLSLLTQIGAINPMMTVPLIGYFFQDFLSNGYNCADRSFMGWANSMSSIVITPVHQRIGHLEAWRIMTGQLVEELAQLKKLLLEDPENWQIAVMARRAQILIDRVTMILANWHVNKGINVIEGEILASESKAVVDIFKAYIEQIILNYPSYTIPVRKPRQSRERAVWFFLLKWEFLNNPIRWVQDAYFRDLNKKNMGVEVSVGAYTRNVEPEKPQALRQLIGVIVRAAAKEGVRRGRKVRLRFEMDAERGELIIGSPDLRKIMDGPTWGETFGPIIELNALHRIRFESIGGVPVKMFIPFSFKIVTSPPFSPSGSGGAGPIASPSKEMLPSLLMTEMQCVDIVYASPPYPDEYSYTAPQTYALIPLRSAARVYRYSEAVAAY